MLGNPIRFSRKFSCNCQNIQKSCTAFRIQRLFHITHVNKFKESDLKLKSRSKSSQLWLMRQWKDPFVKKARYESYRCRSAFKLIEINVKHQFLKPGGVVIDCGAAPGSWSQVAVSCVNALGDVDGPVGTVIGIDLQSYQPVKGSISLQSMDITQPQTQEKLLEVLKGKKADAVISDMAPIASGLKKLDHTLIIKLCLVALKFSTLVLKDGGTFVCKLWSGEDEQKLKQTLERLFTRVKPMKPAASRSDSAEIFFICKGLNKS